MLQVGTEICVVLQLQQCELYAFFYDMHELIVGHKYLKE